jgi:hypothetical protein
MGYYRLQTKKTLAAASPAADTTAGRPSDVSASEANPYDPWTPVVPPRFVGRVGVLRRLDAAMEEGRSISLVGDWRIGKSSVLATWLGACPFRHPPPPSCSPMELDPALDRPFGRGNTFVQAVEFPVNEFR